MWKIFLSLLQIKNVIKVTFDIQKYFKKWKSELLLKEWIEEFATDKYMVLCKYCKCALKVHRALLIEHTKTSKHIKATEPFSNQKQLKLNLTKILQVHILLNQPQSKSK